MGKKTPLYQKHVDASAKIVDFGGWDMPLHYGSQVEEHHQVRKGAGVFDVSHMTVVDITGTGSEAYLRYLLANDVSHLKQEGKALYTGMLNHSGGILDDLIVYKMADGFRLVVNCATRDKDLRWMNQQAIDFVSEVIINERADLGMLAVQGPKAQEKLYGILDQKSRESLDALSVFQGCDITEGFFARTGYTGEAGFEIIVSAEGIVNLWQALLNANIKPIGLGARDTLRLEAGMNLYGSDMDESVSPLQAGMAWTIAWEDEARDFIGRKSLEEQRKTNKEELVGLVLKERGVLRSHQKVIVSEGEGEITSGTFSPTLGYSIAFARIPKTQQNQAQVEIRNKTKDVAIVRPPFVRNGQQVYKLKE